MFTALPVLGGRRAAGRLAVAAAASTTAAWPRVTHPSVWHIRSLAESQAEGHNCQNPARRCQITTEYQSLPVRTMVYGHD